MVDIIMVAKINLVRSLSLTLIIYCLTVQKGFLRQIIKQIVLYDANAAGWVGILSGL